MQHWLYRARGKRSLLRKCITLKQKKRVINDCEGTPKAKQGRPKLSLVLTQYPPLRETGDEEITVQRNFQLLIKEKGKWYVCWPARHRAQDVKKSFRHLMK